MMQTVMLFASLTAATAVMSACVRQPAAPQGAIAMLEDPSFKPAYKGIETTLLAGDLVQFHVAMTGARSNQDVSNYAECAAAQYALIRGFGFARHWTIAKTHVIKFAIGFTCPTKTGAEFA